MASSLVNFPDQIEVTLGSGWTGKQGLAPGASILQQKDASADRWTEDGINTANDQTNRLRFLPAVNSYSMGTSYNSVTRNVGLAAANNDSWRNVGHWSVHQTVTNPTGNDLDYVFKDLWSGSGSAYGSGYSGFNQGFFTDSQPSYNNEVFLALEQYDPATPPADVMVFAGSSDAYDKVQLTWLTPLGGETYTIDRSPYGQATWTTVTSGVTATSYEDTGLAAGTRYDYRIQASNSYGASNWSAIVSVQTRGHIAGTVLMDADGSPVQAARVLVRDPLLARDVAVVDTDASGVFDVSVDPGILAHVITSYKDGSGNWLNALSYPGVEVAGVKPIYRRVIDLAPIAFYPLSDAGPTVRDAMGLQDGTWWFNESNDGGLIQQKVALIEDSNLRFAEFMGITGAAAVVDHRDELSFQCDADEFTILFWVNSTDSSQPLLGKGRQSSGDYQILVRIDNSPTGTLEIRLGGSSITFNSSVVNDGKTHAVAIRMQNVGGTQTASVWVDGTKDAETTTNIGSDINAHPWVFGGYWSDTQPESVMNGTLGLVAFLDRPLTDTEIQSVGVVLDAEGG